MKKAIVTGGAGFIGSHIVDKLVEMGVQVAVIDDFSSSPTEDKFNKGATYYKLDIVTSDIDFLFTGVDYVYHLAAESRIIPAIQNPLRAMQVNSIGTTRVLEAARKHKIKRVVYSGTSSVYGLTESFPTIETCAIDCLNPYATSKLCGEEICKVYSKLYDLDTVILRYFNVYGERSPIIGQYAPVVGIFLNQHKNNTALTVVGDGKNKRDFVYVKDVVEANMKASFMFDGKLEGNVFNIGSGVNYEILEIANKISSNVIHISPRLGEAKTTLAGINKSKDILNWIPKLNLFDWIDTQL